MHSQSAKHSDTSTTHTRPMLFCTFFCHFFYTRLSYVVAFLNANAAPHTDWLAGRRHGISISRIRYNISVSAITRINNDDRILLTLALTHCLAIRTHVLFSQGEEEARRISRSKKKNAHPKNIPPEAERRRQMGTEKFWHELRTPPSACQCIDYRVHSGNHAYVHL